MYSRGSRASSSSPIPFSPSSALLLLFSTTLLAASAQDSSSSFSSVLKRQSLSKYELATCNDGRPAAYYHDESLKSADAEVMIYLPNDDSDDCDTVRDCQKKCRSLPEGCTAPIETELVKKEGIWSKDRKNNPFANYFKVLIPSCSSDEFSGTRGSSAGTGNIAFHGRHIFGSVLRDLTAKFGMDRAQSVVLVGSGSGSRAAARNCDFLSKAISSVNPSASVRCILDGIDLVPYWVTDPLCHEQLAQKEEAKKFLWGREDDETCVTENKDLLNSTELALACGTFSRYWKHVSTPVFFTANQLSRKDFSERTCGITSSHEDYSDYTVGWRQGVLALAEAISVDKAENGWFIPNCDEMPALLNAANADMRRAVRVPMLENLGAKVNVLQAINNWLTTDSKYQAIDAFGVPNEVCSATKSLPLDLRPDTFLPEVTGKDGQKSAPVRRFPGDLGLASQEDLFGFSDAPAEEDIFAFGPRTRFNPPRELTHSRRPAILANAADFPARDVIDYDDLSLGVDFDYGTDTGFSPGVGLAVGGGVVANAPGYEATRPYPRHPVVHSPARRKSLWRKLYYLEYLRNLYTKNFNAYHNEYYGSGIPPKTIAPAGYAPSPAPQDYPPVAAPAVYVPKRRPPPARAPAVYVPARAPAKAHPVVYRPRYNSPAAYKPAYKPAYAPAPARQLHPQQRPHIGPAAAAASDHYHPHHHGPAVYQRPKPQKAPAARRPHPGYAGGPPAYPDYAPVARAPAFDPRNPAFFARIQEQDKEIPEDAIDLFEDQSESFRGDEDPDSQVEKIEKLIDNSS